MDIEKNIRNLAKYCEDDKILITDDFNSDFVEFCRGHIEDIEIVLKELAQRQRRLNRQFKLLQKQDITMKKMAKSLLGKKFYNKDGSTVEFDNEVDLIKYFEKKR